MSYFTTKFSLGVLDEIVKDTDVDATVSSDCIVGPGKLYSIHLKNDDSSNVAYLKFSDSTDPTVGTTTPDLTLKIAAATEKVWTIVDGLAFTNLSFWATGASGDDDDDTGAADDLKVFMVLR